MSRLNLDPEKWGKHSWFFLESIGLSFPDKPTQDELNSAIQFIKSLKDLLPCDKCRVHYNSFTARYPPEQITDGVIFRKYILSLHNNVRQITGGKMLEESDVMKYYINQYSCINTQYLCIIVIILILLVIFSVCLIKQGIKRIRTYKI